MAMVMSNYNLSQYVFVQNHRENVEACRGHAHRTRHERTARHYDSQSCITHPRARENKHALQKQLRRRPQEDGRAEPRVPEGGEGGVIGQAKTVLLIKNIISYGNH